MKRSLPILEQPNEEQAPLPELQDTLLDWDDVDCVLADIDDLAEVLEILLRSAEGAPRPAHDLVAARDAFHAGEVIGMRITYRFADCRWCDTLQRLAEGARLVRIQQQDDPQL